MASRRTLDSLPNELKTTIARKCFEADQNNKEMIENLSSCPDLHPDAQVIVSDSEIVHGRAVSSLSLVSKSWREITACWIFRKLHVDKILEPIFLLRIARLRSDLFLEADIGTDYRHLPLYHQNMILSQLSSSLRLTTLSIASESFNLLSPQPHSADYVGGAQRNLIIATFARVKHVTFRVGVHGCWPSARLIGMFPGVRRITVEALGQNIQSKVELEIPEKGVGACSHLV